MNKFFKLFFKKDIFLYLIFLTLIGSNAVILLRATSSLIPSIISTIVLMPLFFIYFLYSFKNKESFNLGRIIAQIVISTLAITEFILLAYTEVYDLILTISSNYLISGFEIVVVIFLPYFILSIASLFTYKSFKQLEPGNPLKLSILNALFWPLLVIAIIVSFAFKLFFTYFIAPFIVIITVLYLDELIKKDNKILKNHNIISFAFIALETIFALSFIVLIILNIISHQFVLEDSNFYIFILNLIVVVYSIFELVKNGILILFRRSLVNKFDVQSILNFLICSPFILFLITNLLSEHLIYCSDKLSNIMFTIYNITSLIELVLAIVVIVASIVIFGLKAENVTEDSLKIENRFYEIDIKFVFSTVLFIFAIGAVVFFMIYGYDTYHPLMTFYLSNIMLPKIALVNSIYFINYNDYYKVLLIIPNKSKDQH